MALAMEMPKKSLTSTRGFASMDREKQLAIARKGGESVPNEKRSFSQDRRLAADAGRKGGQSVNPSAAFRAITRSHRRPGARADLPRTPGRKKPTVKDEASFVKRKRGSGA
jgi:uncharacterized protein